jgi:Recombination endonuclease VII
MKRCPKCGESKPLDAFHRSSKAMDGRQGYCKECMTANNRVTQKERGHKWYATKGKAQLRNKRLFVAYGITVQQYEAILIDQKGRCAICGGDNGTSNLAVDHDHVTGEVRQLLCHKCNLMIASENSEILEAGANYLRRHKKGG